MKKNVTKFALVLVGIIAILLGLLWFLQGTATLQMCPILCFVDCECLTGGSLLWELVGLIVLFIGIAVFYIGLRCSGKA